MMLARPGPLVLAVAVATAAMSVRPACAPHARVLRIAPGIDPEMARQLVSDDDAAFSRYCRSVGTVEVKSAMIQLGWVADTLSEEEHARAVAVAAPYIERLASALATEFDCPDYLRDFRWRASLTASQRWQVRLIVRDHTDLNRAWAGISDQERRTRLLDLRSRYAAFGDVRSVYGCEAALASCAESVPARVEWLKLAIAHARSVGDRYLPCQYLGELGAAYLRMNDREHALPCYDEALRIATHCRFSDQVVRILMFYSHHYVDEGRVALALDVVQEAQRVSRELGGGTELRIVMDAMSVFARLDCWEAVERLVDRAVVLMREREAVPGPVPPIVRLLRAQMRMVRGDVEGAEGMLRDLSRELDDGDPRFLSGIIDLWSWGLSEAGLWERSLKVMERGIALRDAGRIRLSPSLLIRRIQALVSLGRYADAERALDDLDRRREDWVYEPQPSILRDVAVARLRAATGDTTRARASLRDALRAVRKLARSGDSSTGSQLQLGWLDEVRLAQHEILAADPASGYRFEMEWRAMASQVGRNPERRIDEGRFRAIDGIPDLPPRGVVHCVFLPLRASTVRWTATSSGVERDTLPLAREPAREAVRRVLEQIARAGDAPIADSTSRTLRDLATLLLPGEVLHADPTGPVRTLCVSADGPLAALPFEALNLAPGGGYRPLALRWDVARIRALAARHREPAAGPSSIVADPAISPPTRRRFVIASRLDQAATEAHIAGDLWPGARVLTGAEARKAQVLESWRGAPRILLAAHLVRAAEVSFLGFIPLAPTDEPTAALSGPLLEQKYDLDPADVRQLDLSGCNLVVLSSCASGAPDLSAKRVAPSFADAFLDAGARAVVQTLWPVEDRQARTFTTGFLRATAQGGIDPVHALGEARREAWSQGAAPAVWAGWSVGVLDFPRPRQGPNHLTVFD